MKKHNEDPKLAEKDFAHDDFKFLKSTNKKKEMWNPTC